MANVLYFVEYNFGKLGKAFLELDRDDNSRKDAITQIRTGNVIKVLEIDEEAGSCRDVTEELTAEAEQPREPRTWAEIHQSMLDLRNDHDAALRRENA